MSKLKVFPSVPLALIEELEHRFPDRIPDTPPSVTEAATLVGQQSVIRFIRREFERQNNPKEI